MCSYNFSYPFPENTLYNSPCPCLFCSWLIAMFYRMKYFLFVFLSNVFILLLLRSLFLLLQLFSYEIILPLSVLPPLTSVVYFRSSVITSLFLDFADHLFLQSPWPMFLLCFSFYLLAFHMYCSFLVVFADISLSAFLFFCLACSDRLSFIYAYFFYNDSLYRQVLYFVLRHFIFSCAILFFHVHFISLDDISFCLKVFSIGLCPFIFFWAIITHPVPL